MPEKLLTAHIKDMQESLEGYSDFPLELALILPVLFQWQLRY